MSDLTLSRRDEALLREKFPDSDGYEKALARLKNHEPLAYVLGEWYFYNETYKLTPDCLIPRPDTEHVVDELIRLLPENGFFADLCTGSGCIAISTLASRPDARAFACDISSGALKTARENAVLNGVFDRIEFETLDVCGDGLKNGVTFDIIASNPPYIDSGVIPSLEPELAFEPRAALDGGPDGMRFYRAILSGFAKNLAPGGAFVLEIGYDQAEKMRALCRGLFGGDFSLRIVKDYGGRDRVAVVCPNS